MTVINECNNIYNNIIIGMIVHTVPNIGYERFFSV